MPKSLYIVIDNYKLPCSQPVSKKTAEKLAKALKSHALDGWFFYVKKVGA